MPPWEVLLWHYGVELNVTQCLGKTKEERNCYNGAEMGLQWVWMLFEDTDIVATVVSFVVWWNIAKQDQSNNIKGHHHLQNET